MTLSHCGAITMHALTCDMCDMACRPCYCVLLFPFWFSDRYCLAYLEQGALPWQWEPKDRVTNIKKKLFEEECAISLDGPDGCDAKLRSEEACSTAHCRATYDDWDNSAELHELWGCILDAQGGSPVDYDACMSALGGEQLEEEGN